MLLEKNLGQAEAFALEASGAIRRDGRASAAVSFALAIITTHHGDFDAAEDAFAEAQYLARVSGERLAEFAAMEHRLMLTIDRERTHDAVALAGNLIELGDCVRPQAPRSASPSRSTRSRGWWRVRVTASCSSLA